MITGASATSPLQFSQFDLADEEVFMVRNKDWREKNETGPEIFYLKKNPKFLVKFRWQYSSCTDFCGTWCVKNRQNLIEIIYYS